MATFGTQKTEHSINITTAQASVPGTGQITLLAPLDGGATVAANVLRTYRSAEVAKADHGDGSQLHLAAKIAQQNITRFKMVGFPNKATSSPVIDGDAAPLDTAQITAADLPIYEVVTAEIDGTAVDRINYTEADPTGATLDDSGNGEIWVNTKTGSIQASRLTTGSSTGLEVAYLSGDLSGAKEQILLVPNEVVTFAGWRYNAQYYGMYDDLVAWAASNGMVVFAGLDDSVAAADAKPVVEAIRNDAFGVVAAKLLTATDDLTTAYACRQAASAPNQTLKDKQMPKGLALDNTLPYTRADFGDDKDPDAATFHGFGANVITRGELLSSDRCATTYATATILFIGFRRTLNAVVSTVDAAVVPVLTSGVPFTDPGLLRLKTATLSGLNASTGLGYIDPAYTLNFPTLADTTETQRKKRSLEGAEYTVRVAGIVHTVFYTGEVAQ